MKETESDKTEQRLVEEGFNMAYKQYAQRKRRRRRRRRHHFKFEINNFYYDGFAADRWSLGVLLFLLLTGFPPFDQACVNLDKTGGFYAIKTGNLDWLLKRWCDKKQYSQLTQRGIDLMSKLLQFNPNHRLSLEGILEHDWLST